jgi:hypothetical protein
VTGLWHLGVSSVLSYFIAVLLPALDALIPLLPTWAERSLHRFGARIIIGCRFVPGGRTAITLTCGLVGYPRRRFAVATACAAVLWASYAFLIGRLGGKAFEDRPWAGLLLALAVTVVISVLIEAARRAWAWHKRRRERARQPAMVTTCRPHPYRGEDGPSRTGPPSHRTRKLAGKRRSPTGHMVGMRRFSHPPLPVERTVSTGYH